MSDATDAIRFGRLPSPGNSKYAPLLAEIEREVEDGNADQWAVIAEFAVEQSGRDLVTRLKGDWPRWDFTSRKSDDGMTVVFAKLKEGS